MHFNHVSLQSGNVGLQLCSGDQQRDFCEHRDVWFG